MTRDEQKAAEWAALAVEFSGRIAAKTGRAFPDVCMCGAYKQVHELSECCPIVGKKTHALRIAALGRLMESANAE